MKKTGILLILMVLGLVNLNAQSAKEEVDFIQSIFGMEKKALVAEFVQPEDSQKDAFWKLYDEYETARKELGKKRIELLLKYGENFENLNNELARQLLKEILYLTQKNDKLLLTYVKKVEKTTSPIVAMQFHQIEMYILSEIRLSIAGDLPLPEVKK